jgi:hypothetical protein
MAGGAALNIFKMGKSGLPKAVLNRHLWLAVFTFGLMGAARGVDEGLITGIFNTAVFKESLGLQHLDADALADVKGSVASMVQLGSIPGALFAFLACDRYGRVWATRQLCVVWLVGIAIFMGNSGKMSLVYFGRFLAGIGIGETVVVGPVYLSEIAPAPIRGLCTCAFTGSVYLGILIAYFANYGTNINPAIADTPARWLLPTSVHLMFGVLILVASIWAIESPRFLVRVGKPEQALANLCKLRGMEPSDPYVAEEFAGIERSFQEEQEATAGMGWKGMVREIFCIKRNSYRLFLTNLAQLLACWSGGSSITVYAHDLFQIVGITGQNASLLGTAIFGVVKFIAAVCCALFLVAKIEGYVPTASESKASTGAIAMIYLSGVGWALGWNSGQYLLSSELFPLRIRAVCSSITMAMHFIGQYTTNKATPVMLLYGEGLSPSGTFYFFAAISVIGAVWVWLCIPEASGRSLESVDRLFDLPWYKIGLHGKSVAEAYDREMEARYAEEKLEKEPQVTYREAA